MRNIFLFLFFWANTVVAYDIEIDGENVSSKTITKVQSCDGFEVHFITERFPEQYEGYLLKEDLIPGFYGSPLYASHVALIVPGGIVIPQANDIDFLEKILKERQRTYLPFAVKCNGSKIAVRYWSGGNCDYCEYIVEFDFVNRQLVPINPTK